MHTGDGDLALEAPFQGARHAGLQKALRGLVQGPPVSFVPPLEPLGAFDLDPLGNHVPSGQDRNGYHRADTVARRVLRSKRTFYLAKAHIPFGGSVDSSNTPPARTQDSDWW